MIFKMYTKFTKYLHTCWASSSYICESFDPLLSFVGDSLCEGEGFFDPLSLDPDEGDRSFLLREFEFDLSRLDINKR